MGAITLTSYGFSAPKIGDYPNAGPWNSTLTDVQNTGMEVAGIIRQEGPNTYVYAFCGTNGATRAGHIMLPTTGLTDTNGLICPVTLTGMVATAALNASAFAVAIATMATGGRYGWFMRAGIATMPLNSNTAGLAFGTPVGISSSSAACWADMAAATSLGRVAQHETLGTSTQTSQGGVLVYFDLRKTFL